MQKKLFFSNSQNKYAKKAEMQKKKPQKSRWGVNSNTKISKIDSDMDKIADDFTELQKDIGQIGG